MKVGVQTKNSYAKPKVSTKVLKGRKIYTQPDKSLTPREIVERYTRGLPVDARVLHGTYVDHPDTDLEKIAQLDPMDRADYLKNLALQNEATMATIRENAEQSKRAREEAEARKTEQSEESGIDNLDNTMPHDTEVKTKQLRGKNK